LPDSTVDPAASARPVQRRWAWVILAFAVPALVLELYLAIRRNPQMGVFSRFGNIGLPLSTNCVAVLLLLPPKHALTRWIWAVWILAFAFWLVGFVAGLRHAP